MKQQPKKNTAIKTCVTPIQERVIFLQTESVSWLRRFFNVFIELFPLTKKDAVTPKSVKEYPIGENKVEKKPGINPSMSRVISPWSGKKKITVHMNLL